MISTTGNGCTVTDLYGRISTAIAVGEIVGNVVCPHHSRIEIGRSVSIVGNAVAHESSSGLGADQGVLVLLTILESESAKLTAGRG